MADDNDQETCSVEKPVKLAADDSKAGIIYLSTIPTCMNVKIIRQLLGYYGEIGRIYLQPDKRARSDKKNRVFSEGWIEFRDKKIAKRVAVSLNNTQIGGKRRNKWYEERWNMKYLSRFKWTHLNEKLAYERQVHKLRLRTEVTQAKKETDYYIRNVELHQTIEKIKKKKGKRGIEEKIPTKKYTFKQRETENEILSRKRKSAETALDNKGSKKIKRKETLRDEKCVTKRAADNKLFLVNLFSGGVKSGSQDSQEL